MRIKPYGGPQSNSQQSVNSGTATIESEGEGKTFSLIVDRAGAQAPPNEKALRGMEPDPTRDLEKLKARTGRMRKDCEDILDRLGLRYLVEGS